MDDTNRGHPPPERLNELVLGRLPGGEADVLGSHVWDCAVCLQRLESLPQEIDPFLARLQAHHRDGGTSSPETPDRTESFPDTGAPVPLPLAAEQDTHLDFSVQLDPDTTPAQLYRLAQYRVVKPLGQGGMGVVFEAEDEKLRRRVALKVLKPHLLRDPSARQRFLREARATAAIKHDHVVTIYEVGEDRGFPFLAMELLQGESLDRRLERGERLSVAEVLRLGREIVQGLAAAHERGLVHRDVKPANIWLETLPSAACGLATPNAKPQAANRAKLLDFGLVWNPHEDVQVTASGVVVGTPAFMSPEQARHQPLDARSDLFSLGCVLYRLCTGRPPFEGPSTMAILTALAVDTPPPVRRLNPEVPPALADLIMSLLAKSPAQRPPSAQTVLEELQAISAGATRPAKPTTPVSPRSRRWALLAAMLLVGLIVVGGLAAFLSTQGGGPERFTIETDDPDLTFQIADTAVTLHDRSTGRVSRLNVLDHDPSSEEFLVQVTAPDAPSVVRDRTFWAKRGGQVAVRASYEAYPDLSQPPPQAVAPFTVERAKQLQVWWADHLKRPAVVRNSLGMKLVLIPPGEFPMGTPDDEVGQKWEKPRHTVRITRPFYLSAREVTIGQFRAFMAVADYKTVAETNGGASAFDETDGEYRPHPARIWSNPTYPHDDDHPVSCVTWNDAVRFCEWLSHKEGRTCRLPREAEWEYSCRAGTLTTFHTGPTLSAQHARFLSRGPLRVGSFPANAFGLHDMHANIAEWCHDGCRQYSPELQTGPDGGTLALDLGEIPNHALRGGTWINKPALCRSAARNAAPPLAVSNEWGFRVLWELE